MSRILTPAVLAAALMALAPLAAEAQLAPPVAVQRPTLQLGLARPFFAHEGLGISSAVLSARGSVPLRGPGGAFFVEAAIAHGSLEGGLPGSEQASSFSLSNARIGVVIGESERVQGLASVTLPTSKEWGEDDFASGIGLMTDLERIETFVEDVVTLEAGLQTLARSSRTGAGAGARAAVVVSAVTGDESDETEALARYGVHLDFPVSALRVRSEVSGITSLTTEGSFGERSLHFLTVSGALPELALAPELWVRIPLDSDIREDLRASGGIRIRL
jgi:hypothetical protein